MKRFFIAVSLVIFFAGIANAGVISFDPLTVSSTISEINTAMNKVYNEFNGNIEATNIKADSLTEACFADAINPRVRDSETIGNFTYTGMLPATSTDLTSNISAGTSYVSGYRIVTAATAKTYTASKDTWVYIDKNGAFQYEVVNNDASQPATPANSLLLATVVTDGDNITEVTDLRQTTPPGLRVYSDYRQGCIASYDTATTIKVNRGEIELGSSSSAGKRRNTTALSLTWSDLDSGSELSGQYYFIHAYPDPDNSNNFLGKISLSSSDAAGVTDERCIAWFYNDESGNISEDSIGSFRTDNSSEPNIVERHGTDEVTTTSVSWTGIPGLHTRFYSNGRPVIITTRMNTVTDNNSVPVPIIIAIDGVVQPRTFAVNAHAVAHVDTWIRWPMVSTQWSGILEPGVHTIETQYRMDGGTSKSYVVSRDIIVWEQ